MTTEKMGTVLTLVGGPANAKGMDGEEWVRGVPREVAKEHDEAFGDHPSFVKTDHDKARLQWKKLAAAKDAAEFITIARDFAATLQEAMVKQREDYMVKAKVVGAVVDVGTVTLDMMQRSIPGYEPPEPEPEPDKTPPKGADKTPTPDTTPVPVGPQKGATPKGGD